MYYYDTPLKKNYNYKKCTYEEKNTSIIALKQKICFAATFHNFCSKQLLLRWCHIYIIVCTKSMRTNSAMLAPEEDAVRSNYKISKKSSFTA